MSLTAHSLPDSKPIEPPGWDPLSTREEPSHHPPIVNALADHFILQAVHVTGRRPPLAALLSWAQRPSLAGRELPVCPTGKPTLLMLHLLRSLLSRISEQLPTLALFISPFSFPSSSHPLSTCPLQLLRDCHSLVLHCSSGRKVGSRLRRLGEKAKAYFCQLIHLRSEFIYQTFIEHH